jgi:hypothetical protein
MLAIILLVESGIIILLVESGIIGGGPVEEAIDISGRTLDQALRDERGATGDGEPGALGQAEEQAGGSDLKRVRAPEGIYAAALLRTASISGCQARRSCAGTTRSAHRSTSSAPST